MEAAKKQDVQASEFGKCEADFALRVCVAATRCRIDDELER
jgi:hypothetical protein